MMPLCIEKSVYERGYLMLNFVFSVALVGIGYNIQGV